MAGKTDTLVLKCPDCDGPVSARWDQVGQTVECPLCHQPFEVQAPDELASPPARAGRLFHFQCLRCGSILEARAAQCGQSGKCPTCAAVFTVPEMDPGTGLALSDADPGSDGENPTPVHAYAAAGTMAPKLVRHEDDSLAIECPRCGRQSPVAADNCPTCGLPFTMDGVSAKAVTIRSQRVHTAWVLALAGLVFSFCAGIGAMFGVIAIGLALMELRKKDARTRPALAAIALGVVDCIIAAIVIGGL